MIVLKNQECSQFKLGTYILIPFIIHMTETKGNAFSSLTESNVCFNFII